MKTPDRKNRATCWKPNHCFPRTAIPYELGKWLLDTASLTLRLQQLCPGRFQVRVLSQQRGAPRQDEMRALRMRHGSLALIRTVQLLCDGQPWIYARTIIPITSLRGKLRRLAHLGTRPLGAMLFADPGMRRGVVELAHIKPGQQLYADASYRIRQQPQPQEIWGRRSVFRIAGKPLLVSEIFLPGFPQKAPARALWKNR